MSGVPKTKPLMEGYDAALDGIGVDACPFDTTPMMTWWLEGWRMAQEHIAAEQPEYVSQLRPLSWEPWIDRISRGEGCA